MVVAIIAIIAGLAIAKMAKVADHARMVAAESDLKTLRAALMDPETGYVHDMRGIPGFSLGNLRLANLLISTNLYGATLRVDDPAHPVGDGCAAPATFNRWNAETERGWRGPYFKGTVADFPSEESRRFPEDAPAAVRGFFPNLSNLRLPLDFLIGKDGCSVYGFPGEPAVIDPWGNPYVLQIPPPQAFWSQYDSNTNLPDEVRFAYARVVSAGPDGILSTPCFGANATNDTWVTGWNEERCRRSRQAGRYDNGVERGDDVVLFLMRNDIDEGRAKP